MELQHVIDTQGEHDHINWRGWYRRDEVLTRKLSGCPAPPDRAPADRAPQALGQCVRNLSSKGLGVIGSADAGNRRLADDEQR
jgi:hypothetical protein